MVALVIFFTTWQIKPLKCSCWKVVLLLRLSLLIYPIGLIKEWKKKFELEGFCSFCDQVYPKIIKHVSTRWLSLKTPVTRTLQLYQPLQSYFFISRGSTNLSGKARSFICRSYHRSLSFFLPIYFTKLC